MDKYIELLKKCINQTGKSNPFPGSFTRYILILNNYLKNKPLSDIESSNEQGNKPKAFLIKYLADGFKINIDLESPLFEDKLDFEIKDRFHDSFWFYKRFFERIELLENHGFNVNIEDLKSGSLHFADKYGGFFIESSIPFLYFAGSPNEYHVYKYKNKKTVINLIDYILKQSHKQYAFNINTKIKTFIGYYNAYEDQDIKEKTNNALLSMQENNLYNHDLIMFLIQNNLNIHFNNDQPLKWAISNKQFQSAKELLIKINNKDYFNQYINQLPNKIQKELISYII